MHAIDIVGPYDDGVSNVCCDALSIVLWMHACMHGGRVVGACMQFDQSRTLASEISSVAFRFLFTLTFLAPTHILSVEHRSN